MLPLRLAVVFALSPLLSAGADPGPAVAPCPSGDLGWYSTVDSPFGAWFSAQRLVLAEATELEGLRVWGAFFPERPDGDAPLRVLIREGGERPGPILAELPVESVREVVVGTVRDATGGSQAVVRHDLELSGLPSLEPGPVWVEVFHEAPNWVWLCGSAAADVGAPGVATVGSDRGGAWRADHRDRLALTLVPAAPVEGTRTASRPEAVELSAATGRATVRFPAPPGRLRR